MSAPNKGTAHERACVPGLDDLLIRGMNLEYPARAMQAAQNAMVPVRFGIHAVGHLLVGAAAGEEPVEAETLMDAGFLLAFLAELQGALGHIVDCANRDLIQAAREGEE